VTAKTFDAQGNLTGTTTLTYNAANELLLISYPKGQYLDFSYNPITSQRTQSVDQDGFTVNYSYDTLGRLSELKDGSGNRIVQYTYNDLGQLAGKLNGNGTSSAYGYDPAGDLESIVNYAPDGKTVNSSFTYTYNSLGEVTSMADAANQKTSCGYDATGQLTQVTLPGGETIHYVYNSAGDRTAVISGGSTTLYSSNADNEITKVGTAVYSYDANGNLHTVTDSSGTTSYTFNDLNQLVSITAPDGTETTFQYSPLGFLVGENVGGAQTNYLVDPTGLGDVVGSYDGSGSLIAHYTYGLGLVSQTGPSGTGYYDFDASGNTVGITGSSGGYANTYRYMPFGEARTITAAMPNPFTFAGNAGVIQTATGLFSMRARDYSPAIGQFTSQDPIGLEGGDANLRRYVGNSPLSSLDPLGFSRMTFSQTQYDAFMNEAMSQWEKDTASMECILGLMYLGNFDTAFHDPRYNQADITFTGGPYAGQTLKGHDVNYESVGWYAKEAGLSLLNARAMADGYTLVRHRRYATPNEVKAVRVGYDTFSARKKALAKTPTTGASGADLWSLLSGDPNALIGPAGYGSQHFVVPGGTWSYTLEFENDGSAAAQDVSVTQQLDTNLDWSTFQLGSFGFGTVNVLVPAGLTRYQTTVAYQNTDGSSLNVQVALDFNVQSGLLTVTYMSVDPISGQARSGVFDGFLPPDDKNGIGEGYVRDTIQPKASLATGTTINQKASVVFDINAPIMTNAAVNTIDTTKPTSSVAALPATGSSPNFVVKWSGSDGKGAGIASYDIYVSDNGGAYALWQSDTTQTSATYNGKVGHTYRFYSVATSNVGLVQPTPEAAQATIKVVQPPPPLVTLKNARLVNNKKHQVTEILVTFSGAINQTEADSTAAYRLATPGKGGSLAAKTAGIIKLKSAVYDSKTNTVALFLSKPLALTQPAQLLIYGTGKSGLRDRYGRLIDGDRNGQAGGNATVTISGGRATVSAIQAAPMSLHTLIVPAVADAVIASGALANTTSIRAHHTPSRS
jgi:RHS repeat-associated protein/uncharacterized repeat protein (TIGR01451 family)